MDVKLAGLMAQYAYSPDGEVSKLPSDWRMLESDSGYASGGDAGAFQIYVNDQTHEIVFAFKGTSTLAEFGSDLAESGRRVIDNTISRAEQRLDALLDPSSELRNYQIYTTGHSLGGAVAQTFALENSLHAFFYNSLPMSSTRLQNYANDRFDGSREQAIANHASQGKIAIGTYYAGEIADFKYRTIDGGVYLDGLMSEVPSSTNVLAIGAGLILKLKMGPIGLLAGFLGVKGAVHRMKVLNDAMSDFGIDPDTGELLVPHANPPATGANDPQATVLPNGSIDVGGGYFAEAVDAGGALVVRRRNSGGEVLETLWYDSQVDAASQYSVHFTRDTHGPSGDVVLRDVIRSTDQFEMELLRTATVQGIEVVVGNYRFDSAGTLVQSSMPDQADYAAAFQQAKATIESQGVSQEVGMQKLAAFELEYVSRVHELGRLVGADIGQLEAGILAAAHGLARSVANAAPELSPSAHFTDALFEWGSTLSSAALQAFRDGLDALLTAISGTAYAMPENVRDGLRTTISTVEYAAQTVVIRGDHGANPFDDPDFDGDSSPVWTAAVSEGSTENLTVYLPYEAQSGGQRVRVVLSGAALEKLSVLVDGEEVEVGADGAFVVAVAEGQREVSFGIAALEDFDADETLMMSAALINASGEATHASDEELSLTLNAFVEQAPQQGLEYHGDWGYKYYPAFNEDGSPMLDDNGQQVEYAKIDERYPHINNWERDSSTSWDSPLRTFLINGFLYYGPPGTTAPSMNHIRGHSGTDRVWLGGGNGVETVHSLEGDDVITGFDGTGNIILAGAGNDWVEGGVYTNHVADYWEFPFQGRTAKLGDDKIYGGAGDDQIWGTSQESQDELHDPDAVATGLPGDWITAGSGNDRVHGTLGDDVLLGGIGEDLLVGGAGMDVLLGDDDFGIALQGNFWRVMHTSFGDSTFSGFEVGLFPVYNYSPLLGSPSAIDPNIQDPYISYYKNGGGPDTLIGGAGNDILIGQAGDDTLYGGADDDVLAGWEGADLLLGGAGNDSMAGDFGRYELPSQRQLVAPYVASAGLVGSPSFDASQVDQAGDDYLDGGAGNDILFGEGGNDTVLGAEGNDTLHGDAAYLPDGLHGNDYMDGGAGNDVLYGHGGDDWLYGGDDDDSISGDAGNDVLDGGSGNDVLSGGDGADTLEGGAGNDTLAGDAGTDALYGGAGDDQLQGGEDDDVLYGEAGADVLQGGGGNDALYGGAGEDVIDGGDGNDFIDGGAGVDIVRGGEGDDTYVFSLGYGQDIVEDTQGMNRLAFGPGITASEMSVALDSATHFATIAFAGIGDSVTFDAGEVDIGGVDFVGGATWGRKEFLNFIPMLVSQAPESGGVLVGNERLRNDLRGSDGDDSIAGSGNDDLLRGGGGADALDGAGGSDRYIHIADEIGIDQLADSHSSARAYLDWFYGGLGIVDWEERGLHGGRFRAESNGEGGQFIEYFGTYEEAFNTYPWATITYVEPLEDIAPVVTRNDPIARAELEAAGVLERDVVEFGSGLALADLNLTVTVREASAQAHPEQPWYGGGTLSVRWNGGAAGFDLDVPDVQYGFDGTNLFTEEYRLGAGIEVFKFDDGTTYSLEEMLEQAEVVILAANEILGTEAADQLDGTAGDDVIRGFGDDDFIRGNGGDDLLDGGAGNDLVWAGDGTDTLFGGTGDDGLYAYDGDDALYGGEGSDSLLGDAGQDLLEGGEGDDYLYGGADDDTYVWRPGDGNDWIDEINFGGGGFDTVRLTGGVAPADVAVERDASSLQLVISATEERFTVSGWSEFPDARIEQVVFDDGTVWSQQDLIDRAIYVTPGITLFGTSGDDLLVGDAGDDTLYGFAGHDTLQGAQGDDWLEGSQGDDWLEGRAGDDSLYAGDGADTLIGGTGRDSLNGGAGDDLYLFAAGHGNDEVFDDSYFGAPGFDVVRFEASVDPQGLRVTRWYENAMIVGSGEDRVAIYGIFNSPEVIDRIEFVDGSFWVSDDVLARVELLPATELDDWFWAGDEDDVIEGLGGDDLVAGGAGNDVLQGGVGADYLQGGPGLDILRGGEGEDELDDYEDSSLLEGGAGSDYLYVEGSAFVAGGADDDWIDNFGDGTIVAFNAGEGHDTVYVAGSLTLSVGGGIAPADLALSVDGDDLVLSIGAADSIRLTRQWEEEPEAWPEIRLQLFGSVHVYDFSAVIDDFRAALAADPDLETFALDGVLQSHALATSETHALGGTLAWQYAISGSTEGLTGEAIRAVLGDEAFGEEAQAIEAQGGNQAPTLDAALADLAANEDAPFSHVVPADAFSDPDAGDALTYSATLADGSALPGWLAFDGTTRAFSGTPLQADVGAIEVRVRASDAGGLYAEDTFTLTVANVNDLPVVSAGNAELLVGTSVEAAGLFSVFDEDGDAATHYEFWDDGAGAGHFAVNGVQQGSGQAIAVSAAALADTRYVATSEPGTERVWVRASDGQGWSAWKSWNMTSALHLPNAAPEVAAPASQTVLLGQPVAAASLFSATDADGDPIVRYEFWDSTAGYGHFEVAGVAQAVNTAIAVSAQDLDEVSFVGAASIGADQVWVRASDGQSFGAWKSWTISSAPHLTNAAPVVTASNAALLTGEVVAADALFDVTDADGDAIVQYQFWDDVNGGGYWSVDGVQQAAAQAITVDAADFSGTHYVGGASGGTEQVWARASDGMEWSAWKPWSMTTALHIPNAAPVVAAANQTVVFDQAVDAASLFSVTDADGDAITRYEFWDSTAGNGYFSVDGVAQGVNVAIAVTAADLAGVDFVGASTFASDSVWVRANDGSTWSEWKSWTMSSAAHVGNAAPVVSASNVTIAVGQVVDAEALFAVTDADGDAILHYQFWDDVAGGGNWSVDGVAQGAAQAITVSAADLADTDYVGGTEGGTEQVWVRASDGAEWSAWKPWSITTALHIPNSAPVVSASGQTVLLGQEVAAASLFSVSDADGDAMTRYEFWDSTAGNGHFEVDGVAQGVNVAIGVTAEQLAATTFVGSPANGSDTVWARAHDGSTWSDWKSWTMSSAAHLTNGTPVVSAQPGGLLRNEAVAASTLFAVSDIDGDAIERYELWDDVNGGGHWRVNGVQQAAAQAIALAAADLASAEYVGGANAGTEQVWVRAHDGIAWGAWKNWLMSTEGGMTRGGTGPDVVSGDAETPILEGGGGDDTLNAGPPNSLLSGGSGNDVLNGGAGNDLLAGGGGNDLIDTGAGSNVIVYNAGGGTDVVSSAAGATNALSLGGGIDYDDITLAKDGDDLVVNTGADDRVVLKDWYAGKDNVLSLQIILDATAAFDAGSADPLYNRKVQTFDFRAMVAAFDQARVESPGITSWAMTNALLQFHLSGTDDLALGGDLAYWYGKNGSFAGISLAAAQQIIGAAGFGSEAQTLRPFNGLQEGFVKLA